MQGLYHNMAFVCRELFQSLTQAYAAQEPVWCDVLILAHILRISTAPLYRQTPKDHASYLCSVKFARDMLRLCARAGPIFENEPRCLFIQSPVYVFGDIHGNLEVRRL